MRAVGIIPARMGSSRFPGKPLATIGGVPMLGHVYLRSRLSPRLDAVYIATCDDEIRRYAVEIGAECVMTSPLHERASDRTAEAACLIERRVGPIDVVVMIQGDEPMIHPDMIDEAMAPLGDPSVQVVNLMGPLDEDEARNPNAIKVVCDRRGDALYFSRQPIPSGAGRGAHLLKQVCIIPFRRAFLTTSPRSSRRRSNASSRSTCSGRSSTGIACGWCGRRTRRAVWTRRATSSPSPSSWPRTAGRGRQAADPVPGHDGAA